MREARAGEEVTCTVTFLEMTRPPDFPWPPAPPGPPMALLHAEAPPNWYFLALYRAVGEAYEWTDRLADPPERLAAFLGDPDVALYTLMRSGWPAGFFVLDGRQEGVCDLAYFGLVPEATGRGLGGWLLRTAVHMAWDRAGVRRVTVNTNSLDHPAALSLYQKVGFVPVRRELHRRVLTRDRLMPG
ncbi:MAG: GNAT family N-acetyltransferase [Alphaproteobacteria bacterium]|nr:MAG: GNAT family N-acetyltransferase [Alphaproteobacteria bacterium]